MERLLWAIGLLVAAGLGYALGASGDDPAAPPPAPAATPADVTPTRVVRTNDCGTCEAERARLEKELALSRKVRDDVALEHTGRPPLWDAETPSRFQGEAFEAELAEVLKACLPDSTWVGSDCGEPPCFAVVRTASYEARTTLEACEAWSEHYVQGPLAWRSRETCVDGQEEFLLAVAPRDALDHLVDPDGNRAKLKTRLGYRASQIRDGWTCVEEE